MTASRTTVLVLLVAGAWAGTTMATPTFVLPSLILTNTGQSQVVFISTSDLATAMAGNPLAPGIQGMNLYLSVSEPFILSDLIVDTLPGLLFTGNSTGAQIDTYSPQVMGASVTTQTGNISADGNIARITVTCPLGWMMVQGVLTTDLRYSPEWDVMSDFAGVAAGQATAMIWEVPEPATILMVALAGVGILRRRRSA